jgi:hypothetical protein
MNKRRQVQEEHEIFLVDAFIAWWESQSGEKLRVVSRPHPMPPEAIVQSDQRSTWIEVTDAFHSEKWAQDLYSYAAPDETHKPMGPGPYVEMDAQIATRFATLLKKKYSKQSYAEPHKKYGPGILLVGMQSPWFNAQTCDLMRAECNRTDWTTYRGYFSHVFISYRSLNQQTFVEWKWDTQPAPASDRKSD